MRHSGPTIHNLYIRLAAAASLLILEMVALSLAVDTGRLRVDHGFASLAASLAPKGLRIFFLACVLAGILAARTGPPGWLAALNAGLRGRLSAKVLFAHLCAVIVCAGASMRLFRGDAVPPSADWLTAAALLGAVAACASAAVLFAPASFWIDFVRGAPWAPLWGVAGAVAAVGIADVSSSLAIPWLRLTFQALVFSLRPVRPGLIVDSRSFLIRDGDFEVTVGWECAGFEGVGLMLVFGSIWLALFRRDFRFPRALLLLPAGMLGIWLLNWARMFVLFLIGSAGAPAVALGGFHSQAGWIAFVGLAVTLSAVSQRLPWISRATPASSDARRPAADEHTPAFLLPFLAILAAGMLAQAASGGFEWFYPLRVVAAGAVLWRFRRSYAGLNWTPGLPGFLAGIAVFLLWLGAERLLAPGYSALGAPAALTSAGAPARWGWLLFRVAGAVVTVPIAEELAFRGYALRRLISTDFAAVDLRRFSWMPFLVSSLLFGILHGRRWIVGSLAGMLFAGAARRRGSIGDAVLAHTIANLLLVAWVLATGDWGLW